MSDEEKQLFKEIVEVIVREVDPETIILFGSRAQGKARPDSDIDLLVAATEPFSAQHSRFHEANRLHMALRNLPISKDLLLYSREEFNKWKTSLNHVIGRAYREGRVLHEPH